MMMNHRGTVDNLLVFTDRENQNQPNAGEFHVVLGALEAGNFRVMVMSYAGRRSGMPSRYTRRQVVRPYGRIGRLG